MQDVFHQRWGNHSLASQPCGDFLILTRWDFATPSTHDNNALKEKIVSLPTFMTIASRVAVFFFLWLEPYTTTTTHMSPQDYIGIHRRIGPTILKLCIQQIPDTHNTHLHSTFKTTLKFHQCCLQPSRLYVNISLGKWTFLYLVVEPTHFKNMRKSNWIISPGERVKIKHIWNHHPGLYGDKTCWLKRVFFWTLAFGFMYYWMVSRRTWQNDDMAGTRSMSFG